MEPTDRKRFAHCLLAASEVYGKPISEVLAEVWWQSLRSYEIGAVEVAFRRHMTNPDTGQFMPKPADVIRILAGTSQDSAQVAWAKVDRAVRAVGPYATVAFDDPLVHRVLQDMGGWIALGTRTEDDWPFIANEFRTRYIGYRQRGEAPDYPAQLVGIADADNVAKGFGAVKAGVTLIGDQSKAGAVLSNGSQKPSIGIAHVGAAVAKRLTVIDGGRTKEGT